MTKYLVNILMSVSNHQEAQLDLDKQGSKTKIDIKFLLTTYTSAADNSTDPSKHSSLNQVCQDSHQELVLVLPGSIVQLQVEYWWELLSLQNEIHQNIDDKVSIMGPHQEINVTMNPMPMVNSASQVSSANIQRRNLMHVLIPHQIEYVHEVQNCTD